MATSTDVDSEVVRQEPVKKRRFRPLKAVRRLFTIRRRTRYDDCVRPGTSSSSDISEPSAGLPSKNFSLSADSVFTASQDPRPERDKLSAARSIPENLNVRLSLQSELFSKLKSRNAGSVDDGLPRSPDDSNPNTANSDEIMGEPLKRKAVSFESERSLYSVNSSELDEEYSCSPQTLSGFLKQRHHSTSSLDSSELDLDSVLVTQSLDVSGARHRVAIRPKARRRPSATRRPSQQASLPPLAALNEESNIKRLQATLPIDMSLPIKNPTPVKVTTTSTKPIGFDRPSDPKNSASGDKKDSGVKIPAVKTPVIKVDKSNSLEKGALFEKSVAVEKGPTIQKSMSIDKGPNVQKSVAVEKGPTIQKSVAIEKGPVFEKSVAVEKGPVFDKSVAIEKRTVFQKGLVEKGPTIQKSVALDKGPVVQKTSEVGPSFLKETNASEKGPTPRKSGDRRLSVEKPIKVDLKELNRDSDFFEIKKSDADRKESLDKDDIPAAGSVASRSKLFSGGGSESKPKSQSWRKSADFSLKTSEKMAEKKETDDRSKRASSYFPAQTDRSGIAPVEKSVSKRFSSVEPEKSSGEPSWISVARKKQTEEKSVNPKTENTVQEVTVSTCERKSLFEKPKDTQKDAKSTPAWKLQNVTKKEDKKSELENRKMKTVAANKVDKIGAKETKEGHRQTEEKFGNTESQKSSKKVLDLMKNFQKVEVS